MPGYEEASNQVVGLMTAIGGSVDAYEDEKPSVPTTAAPDISSFEAAHASVQAHIQHNEVVPSLDVLGALNENGDDEQSYVEETPEDYPSSQDEADWTEAEENFFKEMNIDPAVAAAPDEGQADGPVDDRFNAEFFDCLTDMIELDQAPMPVEPIYKLLGNVISHGELNEIYTAFKFAQDTGEPQTVTLDSGVYEMTPNHCGNDFTLHDTGKGRRYCQQSMHGAGMGEGYEAIEDGDIFIWVIPDDDSVEDLGYLHNQWVFLREEE